MSDKDLTVQRLETAIGKLEEMRDATGTDWRVYKGSGAWQPYVIGRWEDFSGNYDIPEGSEPIQSEVIAADMGKAEAELIVILHRTIVAQIAILEHALEDYFPRSDVQGFIVEDGLALADAILGLTEKDTK